MHNKHSHSTQIQTFAIIYSDMDCFVYRAFFFNFSED